MTIKLIKCEKMNFSDKVMYKCTGFVNGCGCFNELIQLYSINEYPVDVDLECNIQVNNMKNLKLKITNKVVDTEKKGIFNK